MQGASEVRPGGPTNRQPPHTKSKRKQSLGGRIDAQKVFSTNNRMRFNFLNLHLRSSNLRSKVCWPAGWPAIHAMPFAVPEHLPVTPLCFSLPTIFENMVIE